MTTEMGTTAGQADEHDATQAPMTRAAHNPTDRGEGLRFTFSDVDASGRADALQEQLRFQARRFAADRQARLTCLGLRPGDDALDIGCGLGEVAEMLAALVGPAGRVVGVDRSETMIASAARNTAHLPQVHIRHGDAMALDAPDDTFDAVYCERVLMHLDPAVAAVKEAVRVTKPGGRIMLVDPDHSMTRLDVSDIDAGAAIFWSLAQAKMRNPRSGSLLAQQLRAAGIDDVEIAGTVVALREPITDPAAFVVGLAAAADAAVGTGAGTRTTADAVLAEVSSRLADDTFLMLLTILTVLGTKPV